MSLKYAIAVVISTLLFAAVMVMIHRYAQFVRHLYHEPRWTIVWVK